MRNSIIIIAAVCFFNLSSAQELEKEYHTIVTTFIDAVKHKNIEKLKGLVSFPLGRTYPLPDIQNEMELVDRYDEVFDDVLLHEIITSDVKKDWATVGWRGIMLHRGILWLDYDGKLYGLNYESETEQKRREKLIDIDKNSIHQSLKTFSQPILILETKKFRIRIDELDDGTYRYASWSIHSEMNEKPDLVLENGIVIADGTGGNHRYEFDNGAYKYICSINVLGTGETPPAHVFVYENEEEIVNQAALILKK